MSFKRFPSLTNHYVDKSLKWWLSYNPELEDEFYVILEKIHGANIQLIFDRDGGFKVASRNLILTEGQGDNFNGIFHVLRERYTKEIEVLQEYANSISDLETLRVYGEFFGGNIQKGVDYGKEKKIRFFAMSLNDNLISWNRLEVAFVDMGIDYMLAPVLGKVKGICKALDFDVKKNTTLHDVDGENIMEGGVIQPMFNVFFSPAGEWFCIKKKNKEFEDKKSIRKRDPKEAKDDVELYGQEAVDFREILLDYVNETVVESVYSKYGHLDDMRNLGDYIKYVIEDVTDTFKRENDFNEDHFDKKQLRYIYNCGKQVADMLKKSLAEVE